MRYCLLLSSILFIRLKNITGEKMTIKKLPFITFVLLAGYMSPVMSEFFGGVDISAFSASMKNSSVDTGFYGNQLRIRGGYRGDFVGFELNVLSDQDDTNASGFLNYKVGPAVGAYIGFYDRWTYFKVGALITDSSLKNVSTGITDDHTLLQFSAAFGVHFEITKQVFFNADYTYSNGSGEYTNALGVDNPSITTNALAAGIAYVF